MNEPNCDPTLWQLAWQDDRLAELVINHIDGDCGKTPWVWVAPAFRRIGLARALMCRSLRRMLDRGGSPRRDSDDAGKSIRFLGAVSELGIRNREAEYAISEGDGPISHSAGSMVTVKPLDSN